MHHLTNVQQHAPTAARTDRQAARTFDRTDDAARALLGTTCMPHNITKRMRVILAQHVSTAPPSVGNLPRGGERGDSQGASRAPPSAESLAAREARERRG